jgi:RNA polymerase sigma factor (sigma-70 family)
MHDEIEQMTDLLNRDDDFLAHRAVFGDRKAVSVIYGRYLVRVTSYLTRKYSNLDEIEIDSVFCKLLEQLLRSFTYDRSQKASLSTWLMTIADNLAKDVLRERRMSQRAANPWESVNSDVYLVGEKTDFSDSMQIEQTISRSAVHQILLQSPLSPREQLALQFFFSDSSEDLKRNDVIFKYWYPILKTAAARLGVLFLFPMLRKYGREGIGALLSDSCVHPIHFARPGQTLPRILTDFAPWDAQALKFFDSFAKSLTVHCRREISDRFLILADWTFRDVARRISTSPECPERNLLINRNYQYLFLASLFCGPLALSVIQEGVDRLKKHVRRLSTIRCSLVM